MPNDKAHRAAPENGADKGEGIQVSENVQNREAERGFGAALLLGRNFDNVSHQELQAEIKRQLKTKEYLDNPIYHWAVRMAEEATEQARLRSDQ